MKEGSIGTHRIGFGRRSNLGTWVWDVMSDRLTTDERFAHAFGLDPDECRQGVSVQRALDAIHEDDRERVRAAIEEAVTKNEKYRCEYRVKNRDGMFHWVEAIGKVELSADGKALRFPGLVIDIETRRAALAERDRATTLLQALLEAVPGAVYAKQSDGRLMFAMRGIRPQ